MMVVPPVLVVQGIGCVVSKFGEDLSSGSKVMAQNVHGVSFFFGQSLSACLELEHTHRDNQHSPVSQPM